MRNGNLRPVSGQEMPPKTRVVMIGAGGMANAVHYPSLAGFDDVEIVGICERNRERLDSTAERFGIEGRFYAERDDDYQLMIHSLAPDAVYAIGQPNIMFPIWAWCLENGCNLYIEKPMGLSAHQARALAYLAN